MTRRDVNKALIVILLSLLVGFSGYCVTNTVVNWRKVQTSIRQIQLSPPFGSHSIWNLYRSDLMTALKELSVLNGGIIPITAGFEPDMREGCIIHFKAAVLNEVPCRFICRVNDVEYIHIIESEQLDTVRLSLSHQAYIEYEYRIPINVSIGDRVVLIVYTTGGVEYFVKTRIHSGVNVYDAKTPE